MTASCDVCGQEADPAVAVALDYAVRLRTKPEGLAVTVCASCESVYDRADTVKCTSCGLLVPFAARWSIKAGRGIGGDKRYLCFRCY